jgi:hypothetical protein
MRRYIFLSIIMALTLSSMVDASQITLKKHWNLSSQWEYSVNNKEYQKLDGSAMNLYSEMAGNETAQQELLYYKPYKSTSEILIFAGGFSTLTAIVIAAAQHDKEAWTYASLSAAGGGVLLVLGTLCSAAADKHLKNAVEIFNGHRDASINLRLQPLMESSNHGIKATLSYTF